jgi:hypothetical protein
VKVYEIAYQEDSPTIVFPVDGTHGALPALDGHRVAERWPPLVGRLAGPVADAAYLCPGAIVVNARVWTGLCQHLGDTVEVLPITLADRPWHVLNVLNVVEVLDRERSEIKYFKSSGRVMRVVRYAFRGEGLDDAILFKVPELARAPVFGTDRFRELLASLDITGLRLVEVWSSEPTVGS